MPTISNTQMETIIAAVSTIFSKTKEQAKTWKTQSPVVVIISIAIILVLAGGIGYYIVTSRIGPLLIMLAVLMPMLCFGIYQSTANLDKAHKEFIEYNDSVGQLLDVLNHGEINEELIAQIREALKKATDESDDVCEVLDPLDLGAGAEAEELIHTSLIDSLQQTSDSEDTNPSGQADIIPVDEEDQSSENDGSTKEDLTIVV